LKNQYFGDINDYRKYGLLRCITEASGLPVGVCWMLTEDDDSNDGQDRRYLGNPSKYRSRDPDLYDRLLPVKDSEVDRNVKNARLWDLLPGAEFFEKPLQHTRPEREQYFSDAFTVLARSPVIFLDPDIGIVPPSGRKGRLKSDKWVFGDEIEDLYAGGHSLVIYQHFPKFKVKEKFINDLGDELQARLGTAFVEPYRTAYVLFFIIGRPEHQEQLAQVADLVTQRWGGEIQPQHQFMSDTETWVPEPDPEPYVETVQSDSDRVVIEPEEAERPESPEANSDVPDPEERYESEPDPIEPEPVIPDADLDEAVSSRLKVLGGVVQKGFSAVEARFPFRIVRK